MPAQGQGSPAGQRAVACLLLLLVQGALAQSSPAPKARAFELSGQAPAGCIMPHMPAAVTYNRLGPDGQMNHTTTPCREDEGMCGMSLNSYADGSHVCIAAFRNQDSCRPGDCKPGWRHRCTIGWWKKTETCLPGELKQAQLAFKMAASGGGQRSGTRQSDAVTKQIDEVKPRIEARERAASADSQCGRLSPDVTDIFAQVNAIARAEGLPTMSISQGEGHAGISMRHTIDDLLKMAGTLDRAAALTRAQVTSDTESLRTADCGASSRHAAACRILELSIQANQRYLDWLLCHRRARGGA